MSVSVTFLETEDDYLGLLASADVFDFQDNLPEASPGQAASKPMVLYVSAQHAREWIVPDELDVNAFVAFGTEPDGTGNSDVMQINIYIYEDLYDIA